MQAAPSIGPPGRSFHPPRPARKGVRSLHGHSAWQRPSALQLGSLCLLQVDRLPEDRALSGWQRRCSGGLRRGIWRSLPLTVAVLPTFSTGRPSVDRIVGSWCNWYKGGGPPREGPEHTLLVTCLTRPPLTSPCLLYSSLPTTEVLVPAGRGGHEGDGRSQQPEARGRRDGATL